LAWTSVGGDLLTIEATAYKGKGKLNYTGQLGDVMKESIQAAMTPRNAASIFSFKPPMGVISPRRVISPVMATSALTLRPVSTDTNAVHKRRQQVFYQHHRLMLGNDPSFS
jgi:hypothetical protein